MKTPSEFIVGPPNGPLKGEAQTIEAALALCGHEDAVFQLVGPNPVTNHLTGKGGHYLYRRAKQ